MRDKQWKQWGGECPRCGSDAQVLTVAGGRYAYDGDEAKCQECGLAGSVTIDDDEDGDNYINWEDQ